MSASFLNSVVIRRKLRHPQHVYLIGGWGWVRGGTYCAALRVTENSVVGPDCEASHQARHTAASSYVLDFHWRVSQ